MIFKTCIIPQFRMKLYKSKTFLHQDHQKKKLKYVCVANV